MNQFTIIDDMQKESKKIRNIMVFGYIFSILMPLSVRFSDYITKNNIFTFKDLLMFFFAFFLFGNIGLYGFLYTKKYKVLITKEKININTLFKNIEVNLSDVKDYDYKRYKKSIFYQFDIFYDDKKVMLSTRYKQELENILNEAKQNNKSK